MDFLLGANGFVALILLCALLFIEESGIPLFPAPGELIIIFGGILVGSGGMKAWILVPALFVSGASGAFAGFMWASTVGSKTVYKAAKFFKASEQLEKASLKLKGTGSKGIAVSRLIPGFRVWTTLVAGMVKVERKTFLIGVLPIMFIWIILFTVLGALIGAPVEHFFGMIHRLAIRGAVILAIAVGTYIGIRKLPHEEAELNPLLSSPSKFQKILALLVDGCIVAAIILGPGGTVLLLIKNGHTFAWFFYALFVGIIFMLYVLGFRKGFGSTAGEKLFGLSYAHGVAQIVAKVHPSTHLDK